MGAQSKPICAIVGDYFVIGLFGITYWATVYFAVIHRQCIPGNQNSNPSVCNQSQAMENKTPLLGFPYINNSAEWHPVPVWGPYILGASNWMLVIILSLIIMRPSVSKFKDIFRKIEALWREVLTTIMITQWSVGLIKTYVGRPRPNYENYINVDSNDAISSFPSGHASSSFCIHMLLVYHVMSAMNWAHGTKTDRVCGADNVHSLFGARLWQKTRYVLIVYI